MYQSPSFSVRWIMHAFWLALTYDLLEGRCIGDSDAQFKVDSGVIPLASFAAARAGVTQRSPSHAAASNRHTFLSWNKPITVRLSFSCGGSRQKCQPITWLLLFAKWPSKWRIVGCFPLSQNFRKKWSTSRGGPLWPVGPVRPKLAAPFLKSLVSSLTSMRSNRSFGRNVNGTLRSGWNFCFFRTMSFHFSLVSSTGLWPVGLA